VAMLKAIGFELYMQLIKTPPKTRTPPAPILYVPDFTEATPLLQLTDNSDAPPPSLADLFAAVEVSLPPGLVPVEAPANLVEMLGPPANKDLVGEYIIFHWQGDGWFAGEIKKLPSGKKNAEYHKTRRGTKEMVNISEVDYGDGDVQPHVLSIHDYAASPQADAGSWCLLGADTRIGVAHAVEDATLPERFRKRGKTRARARAPPIVVAELVPSPPGPHATRARADLPALLAPTLPSAEQVRAMPAGQRAELQALLAQCE